MSANETRIKAAVTVAEMARMVGLSRARFYQLQAAGLFPPPVYCVSNRRPFYDQEAQKVCLEVRRRNCGINGETVLFYSKRGSEQTMPTKRKPSKPNPKNNYATITQAVQSLGLAAATERLVADAIAKLFPTGIEGKSQSEMIRSVFVHLQRQNSADNLGR